MTWRLTDLPIEARQAAERAAAAQGSALEVWLVEALRASLPPQADASQHRPAAPEVAAPQRRETTLPPDASAAPEAASIAGRSNATDFGSRIAAQLERIRQQPLAAPSAPPLRDDSWTPLVPRLIEAQRRLPQSDGRAPSSGGDALQLAETPLAESDDSLQTLGATTVASPTITTARPALEITAPAPQATATLEKKRPALPGGPPSLLPLAAIMPARHRLRRGIDEHKLTALETEIGIHGVREPVLVRPATDRACYEIVAGERRRLAAERAGMTEIPAIVVEADDGAALLLSLAENLGRNDFTPLDEARAYLRLLTEFRVSPGGLAERLGVSRLHVASSLRLLGLPQRARQAIESGRLNTEQAHSLLDAADPDAAAERLAASARLVS